MIINDKWVKENYHGERHFVIPEGATEIGDWAFVECENLESVTIPEGVTEIADSAFVFHGSFVIRCKPFSCADIYAHNKMIKVEYISDRKLSPQELRFIENCHK